MGTGEARAAGERGRCRAVEMGNGVREVVGRVRFSMYRSGRWVYGTDWILWADTSYARGWFASSRCLDALDSVTAESIHGDASVSNSQLLLFSKKNNS
jgi:hypothetical protein